VDEALRELLEGKTETAIHAETVQELLGRLDSITPVTLVEVAAPDLTLFDALCTEMAVRQ
jgi:hypothetical protein